MSTAMIPAAFHRGGTSKAVMFRAQDLPADRGLWDAIFLHVLGSPDPHGRQLNGMGGGISSLSKVCVVGPSGRTGVDLDYTFCQVAVDAPVADYGAMCGNMASAIGPFAVNAGLVEAGDGPVSLRILNTNTNKLYDARFDAAEGRAVEEGDFEIAGVAGTGARIALGFLDPGGAASGALLPSGRALDLLDVGDGEVIEASLVDASNPVVFVRAEDLGVAGTESPEALEATPGFMARMDRVRRAGAVAMGMAEMPGTAILSNPKVAVLSAPQEFRGLDGAHYGADSHDIAIRMISMERLHKAVTLTAAMCLGVACAIPGSLPDAIAQAQGLVRIGNPSGVLPVECETARAEDGSVTAKSVTCFRTQRALMEGSVPVPRRLLG